MAEPAQVEAQFEAQFDAMRRFPDILTTLAQLALEHVWRIIHIVQALRLRNTPREDRRCICDRASSTSPRPIGLTPP